MVPGPRARAAVVLVAALTANASACGSGTSSNPPPPNGNAALTCLTDLETYCCSDAAPRDCIPDFASASACASWPSGSSVHVYTTPCHGLTAVRVEGAWSTFYMYGTNGALVAIGDNAASVQDPRDTTVECGAGDKSFSVPSDCSVTWLSTTGAQACAGGTPAPAAYCH